MLKLIARGREVIGMWMVPEEKLNFRLPYGFLLVEESEFVHLFHGEERIASFHHKVALPAVLQSVAEEYLRWIRS